MSEEQQSIVIPVSEVTATFKIHLEQQNNKRILFSAPFGAGKSYFLNEYFERNEEVLSIRLHPVDYSVANNEDIFELMKHDIINALIEKYGAALKLDKKDFSDLLLAQEFMRNRMDLSGIGKAIITALLPHGAEIVKIGEEVKKLNDDFNDFKAEINADQEKEIKIYLTNLKNQKGSIRENDAITVIIKDYVKRIKAANGNKSFIFILDDLDRLDPEHLFRLFNVFTAHHDSKTDSNKFDFDQLIFVCDVKNIHHMFKHKYGKKVDFSGYIDKFYSSHIFYFDFKKYLKDSVKTLLMNKYEFDQEGEHNVPGYLYQEYDFKNTVPAKSWGINLNQFIGSFIEHDLIKIRSFERFQCYRIPMYQFEYSTGRKFNAYGYAYLVLTHILQQFFPRHYEYEKALKTLSDNYNPDYSPITRNHQSYDDEGLNNWLMEVSVTFLMNPAMVFEKRLEETNDAFLEYTSENGQSLEIHYRVNYEGIVKYLCTKVNVERHVPQPKNKPEEAETTKAELVPVFEKLSVKRPNAYWFFLQAFKQCLKRNYLKP